MVVRLRERLGEFKKRSKCVKGKHLDGWFREKRNRDSCKLPEVDEDRPRRDDFSRYERVARQQTTPRGAEADNAKRIYTEETNIWNKKLVYSWDYDGPAVDLLGRRNI